MTSLQSADKTSVTEAGRFMLLCGDVHDLIYIFPPPAD